MMLDHDSYILISDNAQILLPCNESEMQVKEFVNLTTGAYMALYQPTAELKYVYHALLVYSLWHH